MAGFSTKPAVRYIEGEIFVFYTVILRSIILAFIPFLLWSNQVTAFGLLGPWAYRLGWACAKSPSGSAYVVHWSRIVSTKAIPPVM